jgi:uncharacterized protein YyaL (SSP411 family)
MSATRVLLSALLSTLVAALFLGAARTEISWQKFAPEQFQRAKSEKRLVILDLEAVWCHWCHVMDEKTYSDPQVISLIKKGFVALRVDQDSRPDLSRKYEDYGWPATVFFDADGHELAKRAGYIPASEMQELLEKLLKDPSPMKVEAARPHITRSSLDPVLTAKLKTQLVESYDSKLGGWKISHKFLDPNLLEWLLSRASAEPSKDADQAKKMALQTLDAQMPLVDPVWGGAYQYSVDGVWGKPHFEKIMSVQLDYLRIYSLAYLALGEPRYLKLAQSIEHYVKEFLLSPEGAFWTSQDADLIAGESSAAYFALDDQKRRKLGIPRVDKSVYARETAWAIQGELALYAAEPLPERLELAVRAIHWVETHRKRKDGGFLHSEKDAQTGPYLGDQLAMAQAYFQLYQTTADRSWLSKTEDVLDYIARQFSTRSAVGFSSAAQAGDVTAKLPSQLQPEPNGDENLQLARLANLTFQTTGRSAEKKITEQAMRYLTDPEIASDLLLLGGILLIDHELSESSTHLTIVGDKKMPAAQALYLSALAFPSYFKRLDWVDSHEPALPNTKIKYPVLSAPAAFLCSGDRCSLPSFTPTQLKTRVSGLNGK